MVDDSRWRIGGWNRWASMITVIDCAWMLDGATKDRVYALSLASRSKRGQRTGARLTATADHGE
ncbi:hypothetical protein PIB30_021245 [Stylosanthes scabra]|uniref:Transposase n=1 Tax=Stylosanthes scabra TaxID=79078 RepID=A0ABU6W7D3_9FABA|nr:hypothetical protein [Stylosanthes scabra]